jgi:hypothetical protein
MKKRYLLPVFVVAGLASQALADHCEYSGSPAYCQWSSGCFTINNDYAPNVGTPCNTLIAACEADGSVYTGVTPSALNENNGYGENVKCKENGGTWRSGKPEIVGTAYHCLYSTGMCWPEQDTDACIAANGSVFSNVPPSGEGEGGCAGGTWTGDGKNPNVAPEGYCYYGPCVFLPSNDPNYQYACADGGCFESSQTDCQWGTFYATKSQCPADSRTPSEGGGNVPTQKFQPGIAGLIVVPHGRALHISSPRDASVTLYDLNGNRVFGGKVRAGNSVFSLTSQAPGVYYAVVQSGSLTQTANVVLK